MRHLKIWVDDIRPAPHDYDFWLKTVDQCKQVISLAEESGSVIDLIDLDHDAGDFSAYGGDYIRILDWLETTNRNYAIRLHSMNPVGVSNMKRIIEKNNWTEVY